MFENLKTAWRVTATLLRWTWYALVVSTPLLGFWLASSLTAYLNGPAWAAAVAGVLAFPALPLGWEWLAHRRHARRQQARERDGQEPRARWLRLSDRLTLRTLAVNLVFLGLLAGAFPQASFAALSTRGDWMLGDREDAWVDTTRAALFATAGGIEWLYNLSRDNPYERWADEDEAVEEPEPGQVTPDETPQDAASEPAKFADEDPADPTPSEPSGPRWPMGDTLHPAIDDIPAAQESSPSDVARYLAAREADPYLRVKAIYDWIADHIRYDAPALAAGQYPPQDAATVFETRKAVCAGYARLFKEMAGAIGISAVYVTGVSRDQGGEVTGSGHAWNAVEVDGRWYLLDVTWGAGYVEDDRFYKRYDPSYLFTPPHVLGVDHFPDDSTWQLLAEPLSRGEFVRQPMLRAGFFRRGLELVRPRRSQISVDDRVDIFVDRPDGQHLIADLTPTHGRSRGERCEMTGSGRVRIRCDVPRAGTYHVRLFGNDQPSGNFTFVGQIGVNAR